MEAKIKIKNWFGFGTRLIGGDAGFDFRSEYGDGLYGKKTEVKYLFLSLLYLPIIPLGCYRVDSYSNEIIKDEKWSIGELLTIYFFFLGIPLAIIYFITK